MAVLGRSTSVIVSSLVLVACWTLTECFSFVPVLGKSGGLCLATNERCSALRYQDETTTGVVQRERTRRQGGLTMRGFRKRGKHGPGLTGVQRMINMRERVKEFMDPCRVMLANLDYSINEEDIREFCSQAGPVTGVKIVKKRYAKTSKGFAFVDFNQPITATIAIEDLNGKEFRGRVVEVKPAVTPREKLLRETAAKWQAELAIKRQERIDAGLPEVDEEEEKLKKEKAIAASRSTKDASLPSVDEFFQMFGRKRISREMMLDRDDSEEDD